MSGEEYNPDVAARAANPVEEDPLAELARIVSGEVPQPGVNDVDDSQSASVDETVFSAADEMPDPENSLEMDLEAELMRELGAELAQPEQVEPVAASSESGPEQPADFQQDGMSADEETALNEPEAAPEFVEETVVDPEEAFQDELLKALQNEVSPPPVVEDLPPVESQPDVEPIEEAEISEPLLSEEPASPDTSAAATETVEQPVDDEEPVAPIVSQMDPPVEHSMQSEPEIEPELEVSDESLSVEQAVEEAQPYYTSEPAPVAEPPQSSGIAQDMEVDLGAAFSGEFEQISEQESVNPSASQNFDAEFTATTDAIRSEFESSIVEPQPETTPEASFDAEFGAAFAQELGVEEIPPPGWSEEDSANANADFIQAAGGTTGSPGSENFGFEPQHDPDSDPGHMASISPGHMAGAAQDLPGDANAETQGGKKYAAVALSVALLLGLAAAGYGYWIGATPTQFSGEPVIIKADADPIKIKPEDPGGRVVANQDKASYEKVGGGDTNSTDQPNLISEIEEPADLGERQIEIASLEQKSDERLNSDDQQAEAESQDNNGSGIVPKKVKTVVVKPDGTIVNTQAATTLADIGASALQPSAGLVDQAAEQVESAIVTPKAVDGAVASGTIAIPTLSPLPKPVVAVETPAVAEPEPAPASVDVAAVTPVEQPTSAAPVERSEWVVQVSSQRSPEAAQESFQNLKRRFPGIFDGRAMAIQRAAVEGKGTFYRVRIQTASRSDASQFCSNLTASGGNCFVTR